MLEIGSQPDMNQEALDRLYQAFSLLKTPEEVAAFLDDLLTPREIFECSQRLDVAVRLARGESYTNVTRKTGLSSATVSRVSKCLQGERRGYSRALEYLANLANDHSEAI